MTMLRVRDVTVKFGGITALDHVSFDLNRGEILGMIGPNGAGKTTMFNCISGVIQPDEGTMYFDGRSLKYAPPHERARMGIARTFQNLQLWGSMTVQENVTVPMDALGKRNTLSDALYLPFSTYAEHASSERARAILHVLELDRYVKTLAGDLPAGIQRRVEIARALAVRPQLLLLDEPAAGLDAVETQHLGELLRTVRDRFHVSMLLVDHDMSLVLPVSDYVYVLDFGKVLAKGAPASIQSDPKVIAACIGPNGAGKTTTLRAISGMIHTRSGKVAFQGRDITNKRAEDIAHRGLVHIPEGRGLFPTLSVEDTLRLVSNTLGREPDLAIAYRLFPKLRERRNQAVGTLSGGEQQMVALARAVLARPKLVMVDEMSQGLAPTVVRQLFDIIRVFRDEGIAVLLVEQFVESALDVADRAYIFEHGSVGVSGSAAELRADRKLISGSYLGTAVDGVMVAANGNGHHVDPALMEIVSVKVPAKLKRSLEERAETEGRPTGAVVMDLLEKVKPQ